MSERVAGHPGGLPPQVVACPLPPGADGTSRGPVEPCDALFLPGDMCRLVFLIEASVSEGKALSCNIDLVTLGTF